MRLEGFADVSVLLRAGVYVLAYRGQIVYVGKSKSLYARIYAHRSAWSRSRQGKPLPRFVPVKGILFDEVHIQSCSLEALDAKERELIAKYNPKHNVHHRPKVPVSIVVRGVAMAFNQPKPEPGLRRLA